MSISNLKKSRRIENRLPVAWEGIPFIVIGFIITVILFFVGLYSLACLTFIITIFVVYFFRDPDRIIQTDENSVLAPADGKILNVQLLENECHLFNGPAFKISIFMSIFNVHVNRIPFGGRVEKMSYTPGKFFSANLDKASEQNERNEITIKMKNGRRILFVQIAGLIARRIVCWLKDEDEVVKGQRFGLIRFGSRVDLYLPGDSEIIVTPRMKVKAGETVLGYL